MTSRERILAAIRFDKVDRIPVSPWGTGRIDFDSPLGQELLRKTDLIFDVKLGGDPLLGKNSGIDESVEGDVTTYVIQTPKGPLTSRYRPSGNSGGMREYFLKQPEDIEKMLSIPYEPPDLDISEYERWRDRIGDEGLVLASFLSGVGWPASRFSAEDFCLAWADVPDLVEHMTAVITERLVSLVNRYCEAGVTAFRIFGGEYASTQLGPDAFERLCVAYDRKLVDVMHEHGALAHYHNHGPVMQYLDCFAEVGMDSIDPMEAPPWADADLGEARRHLGSRVCFMGNLDDMEILDKLPTDEVLSMAHERIESAGEIGFILGGTSSGTYGEQAARNFIAMADMVKG